MTRPYRACVPLHLMDSDPRDEEYLDEGDDLDAAEGDDFHDPMEDADDDPALDFAYDPPTLNRSAD